MVTHYRTRESETTTSEAIERQFTLKRADIFIIGFKLANRETAGRVMQSLHNRVPLSCGQGAQMKIGPSDNCPVLVSSLFSKKFTLKRMCLPTQV